MEKGRCLLDLSQVLLRVSRRSLVESQRFTSAVSLDGQQPGHQLLHVGPHRGVWYMLRVNTHGFRFKEQQLVLGPLCDHRVQWITAAEPETSTPPSCISARSDDVAKRAHVAMVTNAYCMCMSKCVLDESVYRWDSGIFTLYLLL